jgi:hypothetical protein
MIEAVEPATDQRLEDLYNPALKNNAVALCTGAWEKIHAATREKTTNLYTGEWPRSDRPQMIGCPMSRF